MYPCWIKELIDLKQSVLNFWKAYYLYIILGLQIFGAKC